MTHVQQIALMLLLISTALGATAQSADENSKKTENSKVEYCMRYAGNYEMRIGSFRKTLDIFGSEGWDLVSVLSTGTEPRPDIHTGYVETKEYLFVFKRKVVIGTKSCDSLLDTLNKKK